jgi:hypothetical protein
LSDKKQFSLCLSELKLLVPNRSLNFKNIKNRFFAVIDWNYAAYCKVRDQEVGGSNLFDLLPIPFPYRPGEYYAASFTEKRMVGCNVRFWPPAQS